MCGLLEEVAEVVDEIDGPGVVGGDEGIGGGVIDFDRCMVEIWMLGRACQKDDVDTRGTGVLRLMVAGGADIALDVEATGAMGFSNGLAGGFARVFSFSLSLLSFLFVLRTSSSFSTTL